MSTEALDLTAQRDALDSLGVESERICVDHGFTGTNKNRAGLREALAACRAGDTFVVGNLTVWPVPSGIVKQENHLLELHAAGEYSKAELAELFSVGRSTVYRAIERAQRRPAEPKRP